MSLTVDAPQIAVWNVLTDFDRMAGIVSNLRSSRVLSRVGNRLVVEQSGIEAEGPLQVAFHSVREVELNPTASMHARLIHGSMRRLEGWTRLVPSREGTLVTSRGEVDAGGWVPPLITPHFIRRATIRQYAEMRQEMLRRAASRKCSGQALLRLRDRLREVLVLLAVEPTQFLEDRKLLAGHAQVAAVDKPRRDTCAHRDGSA